MQSNKGQGDIPPASYTLWQMEHVDSRKAVKPSMKIFMKNFEYFRTMEEELGKNAE